MVVKETKNNPEGAEDVEEVTNELVVVVLQLLLGVPAVAIVCHLLGVVEFWSLESNVCSQRVPEGYWQNICELPEEIFLNWISCMSATIISGDNFNCISIESKLSLIHI